MEDAKQVADSIMNLTQELLKAIYETIERHSSISEKQEKLMKKFVNGTGPVVGTNCIISHTKALREELIEQNIPFMEVNGQKNGTMFLVRKEYENELLNIQEAISLRDTSIAKELSMKEGLSAFKALNVDKVVTISFKDEEMALIAKQKLFQTGQTFVSVKKDDGSVMLTVFPTSVFKPDGNDLEYFKLTYALTQAKADPAFLSNGQKENEETNLLKLRKDQAKYDDEVLARFIALAKKDNHVVLGDMKGNGNSYLEAKDGKIFVINKSDPLKNMEIEFDEDDSINVLAATLSMHTENIFNMTIIDGDFYNENMKNSFVKKDQIEQYVHKPFRPDFLDKDSDGNYIYDKDTISLNRCFTNSAEYMIADVNKEAMRRFRLYDKYKHLSPLKKAEKKHEIILTILKEKKLDSIQNFLNENKYGISKDIREKILDSIIENFEDEHQKSQYEAEIEIQKVRDIEKIYETNEQDYVIDLEAEGEL